MDREEAVRYIRKSGWGNPDPRLGRMRELLRRFGNPQESLKFIHVAGTNGKGSACAMLASVFCSAGYRTGLFTSPEREIYEDRICVGTERISAEAFCRLAEKLRGEAEDMQEHPSEYELLLAAAMLYFQEQHCEMVVLEVGLGGEFDCTNVISCPEAAVIMNIGLDHTGVLGTTLPEIAGAKAGIIKQGSTVICYPSEEAAMFVLKARCKEVGAEFLVADFSRLRYTDFNNTEKERMNRCFLWDDVPYCLGLAGIHQLKNAAVVMTVLEVLRERGWKLSEEHVREGLAAVRWQNRFEIFHENPLVILDGAHNLQGIEALAENLHTFYPNRRFTFVMGILADKDVLSMLKSLQPFIQRFLCLAPKNPRAMKAELLAENAKVAGIEKVEIFSGENAAADVVAQIKKNADDGIVVCGSLFLVAEIRAIL